MFDTYIEQYSHSFTSLMKPLPLLVDTFEVSRFIMVGIPRAFFIRGIFRKLVCTREIVFVATQYVKIVYKYR